MSTTNNSVMPLAMAGAPLRDARVVAPFLFAPPLSPLDWRAIARCDDPATRRALIARGTVDDGR